MQSGVVKQWVVGVVNDLTSSVVPEAQRRLYEFKIPKLLRADRRISQIAQVSDPSFASQNLL